MRHSSRDECGPHRAWQTIIDGFQHEQPDYWLNFGNPWEIERLNVSYPIKFYGHVSVDEQDGRQVFRWNAGESVRPPQRAVLGRASMSANLHVPRLCTCKLFMIMPAAACSDATRGMRRPGLSQRCPCRGACVRCAGGQPAALAQVTAVAYDNPIPGFQTNNTINLRLWAAKPGQEFDLQAFNTGDYVQARAIHFARL